MKAILGRFALVVALGMGVAQAQVSTGQVYELSLTGSLLAWNSGVPQKVAFNSGALVNVARGRDPSSVAVPNEKLALVLVFSSGPDMSGELIVFDTTTQSNLATIANLDVELVVGGTKATGLIAMAGQVEPAGSYTSGWVALTGKVTANSANASALVKFTPNAVQGVLRAQIGAERSKVIISKGQGKVLDQLGVLLIPSS